jgi:uncharacterized protein (TIGR00725 family)
MERKPIIGVMGGVSCTDHIKTLAVEVGKLIAKRGAVVLCGGGSGVMEAVCQGASENGGITIGIMPGNNSNESSPNPYVDIAIFTGMSDARNSINVKSSDIVIAIDGRSGTLSEIALALKNGKSVIGLSTWEPLLDGKLPNGFIIASNPKDAVDKAFHLLPPCTVGGKRRGVV